MANTYFPHRTDDVDVWETDDKDRNNQPQCKQEQDVGGGVVRARFPVHRTAVQQCFINTPSRILLIFTSISQHGFAPAILRGYSYSALFNSFSGHRIYQSIFSTTISYYYWFISSWPNKCHLMSPKRHSFLFNRYKMGQCKFFL